MNMESSKRYDAPALDSIKERIPKLLEEVGLREAESITIHKGSMNV